MSLILFLLIFVGCWCFARFWPNNIDTKTGRYKQIVLDELASLFGAVSLALAVLVAIHWTISSYVSSSQTRIQKIIEIEAMLDRWNAYAVSFALSVWVYVAVFVMLFSMTLCQIIAGTTATEGSANNSFIVKIAKAIGTYRRRLSQAKIILLVLASFTFLGTQAAPLSDIAKAEIARADQGLVEAHEALEEIAVRIALLAEINEELDEISPSHPQPRRWSKRPGGPRQPFIEIRKLIDLVPPPQARSQDTVLEWVREQESEDRSKRTLGQKHSNDVSDRKRVLRNPVIVQTQSNNESKIRIDLRGRDRSLAETTNAEIDILRYEAANTLNASMKGEATTRPLSRKSLESIPTPSLQPSEYLYRALVETSAEASLDPTRLTVLESVAAELPLSALLIDAVSSIARDLATERNWETLRLPLNVLQGKSESANAWIQNRVAALRSKLSVRLAGPLKEEAKRVAQQMDAEKTVLERTRTWHETLERQAEKDVTLRLAQLRKLAEAKFAGQWNTKLVELGKARLLARPSTNALEQALKANDFELYMEEFLRSGKLPNRLGLPEIERSPEAQRLEDLIDELKRPNPRIFDPDSLGRPDLKSLTEKALDISMAEAYQQIEQKISELSSPFEKVATIDALEARVTSLSIGEAAAAAFIITAARKMGLRKVATTAGYVPAIRPDVFGNNRSTSSRPNSTSTRSTYRPAIRVPR
ncbi:MAG: hypothetical protein R8G34_11205 [Paracoccaceae bacterium]|nr:hypothetical protein [Paracoccaceae bacterium]